MKTSDLLADRYLLVRRLGAGGMGQVWLAEDTLLGRQVAIKQLPMDETTSGSESVERALREGRLAARLNSPHAVAVYDLFRDEGHPTLVMEYVDGPTLAQVLRERGVIELSEARRILREVAEAVAAAHALGIVHRDIKPANVLLAADGRAKLADFGIARSASEASITATGSMLGTLAYMAPEVANGAQASPASDMWSMGALLFAMVEGTPPFIGENAADTLLRLVRDPVPAAPNAGDLTPILETLLVRDPSRRFTARGLLGALQPGYDATTPTLSYTAPIAAPPVGSQERGRRRGLIMGAAVVLAILAFGALLVALISGGSGHPPPSTGSSSSSTPTEPPAPSASPVSRWGSLSPTSTLPSGLMACSSDGSGTPVSVIGVSSGGGKHDQACQFASSVQAAYEALPPSQLGTDGIQLTVPGHDQNAVTMTCNGAGPVECTGADPASSRFYDVFLAALGSSDQQD